MAYLKVSTVSSNSKNKFEESRPAKKSSPFNNTSLAQATQRELSLTNKLYMCLIMVAWFHFSSFLMPKPPSFLGKQKLNNMCSTVTNLYTPIFFLCRWETFFLLRLHIKLLKRNVKFKYLLNYYLIDNVLSNF